MKEQRQGQRPRVPPRWASWIVEQALPADVRDGILGDLEEGWTRRSGRPGFAADLWFCRHALGLAIHFLPSRWSERSVSRGGGWDRARRHLRFGIRSLVRRPGWASLSILMLALGIGLTATALSVVYGSVYRGLPIDDAHELVHFEREQVASGRNLAVTPHDYAAWREVQRSFLDLGAYVEAALTLTGEDGTPERVDGLFISANAFDLLRTGAALGRVFSSEEDRPGAPAVMLIGDRAWRNRFRSDPDIVGRELRVNGERTTIVGVMPVGFAFPVAEQYWLPLKLDLASEARGSGRLDVFGRLRPGADLTSARAELAAVGLRLEAAHPETNAGIAPRLSSFAEEYLGEEFPRLVLTMLIGALLVLLVACANVGSLLAAEASRRSGEMAIRRALGATRRELLMQTLTEASLLSLSAAVLGIAGAHLALIGFNRAWASLGDIGLPHGPDGLFWWRFELDVVPLGLTLLVSLAVAASTSALPVLNLRRPSLLSSLGRDARPGSGMSRSAKRVGAALVVAEVTMTTALLLAAGLTAESLLNLTRVDYGFAVDDVVTARVGLPDDRYPDERSRRAFWESLATRLNESPGVESAAPATTLPMRVSRATGLAIRGEGEPSPNERVRTSTIGEGFFVTFRVPLLEGRPFDATDRGSTAPVAIVNESFARRYFPGGSALSRQIRVGFEDTSEPFRTIVGIAPDLWMEGSRDRSAPGVYLPLSQSNSPYGVGLRYLSLSVRTALTEEASARALRAAVAAIDPELPLYDVRTMATLVSDGTGRYRLYGTFYVFVGLVSLVLASMGLYGVLAFNVASSTAEIGIRMALGSDRRSIVALYLGRGLRQVGLGALLGLLLASTIGRGIQTALFEVELWNPGVALGVLLTLGASATLSCYFPARRASLVAPMQAVRR